MGSPLRRQTIKVEAFFRISFRFHFFTAIIPLSLFTLPPIFQHSTYASHACQVAEVAESHGKIEIDSTTRRTAPTLRRAIRAFPFPVSRVAGPAQHPFPPRCFH